MIRGQFVGGRPIITAQVVVTRLGATDKIDFLVDTGADTTIIHPSDAQILGIISGRDFQSNPLFVTGGIGGSAVEYREVCDVLLRHEEGNWDHLLHSIGFAVATDWNAEFPSVLGRDLLRHYRLTFEEMSGLVTLETPGS